ncbi:MAG: hypothetical protein L3J56_09015 [Bacteroidales bacterium]|nr:hypothetical protein [Bacteroidales bacterium]
MKNDVNNIANEPKTEDFSFKNHFVKAALGALYYLFIYIPFILPFKIWGKAATRISLLWDNKSITYNEKEKEYPLYLFYFNYIINFIFDALIFLAWPIGLIYATYLYIDGFEYMKFFGGYVKNLFTYYFSVLLIRLAKETLFFILNYLIIWLFEVIRNIGLLIKNLWLLNFVFRKKEK